MYLKSSAVLLSVVAMTVAGSSATAADAATKRPAPRVQLFATQANWPDFTTGMWAPESSLAFADTDATKSGGLPGFKDEDAAVGKTQAAAAKKGPPPVPMPELTPKAKAQQAQLRKQKKEGEGTNCFPPGPTNPAGNPVGIFYAGDSIFLVTDMDDFLVRRVRMYTKGHDDQAPTWSGDSIGHWEGKTLVIDTDAISPDIDLAIGLPSGGNMHMVERIRLLNPDEIEWKYTITDPGLLAKPWVRTLWYKRHADWQVRPSNCVQGNRDSSQNGVATVDLTDK